MKITPYIAVGTVENRIVVVLPLGLERSASIGTLSFLGHQHGNQNTGLWDKDMYHEVTSDQITAFLTGICDQTGADLLKLENVPHTWHGRPHPLVLADATASPSPVFRRTLGGDFEQLFQQGHSKSSRKNLLRKERHLQAAGEYRIRKAETPVEIKRGLDAFLEQRAVRAGESGIPNVFDTPAAQAFLARLLGIAGEVPEHQPRLMELWYLETGGAIRATYLCVDQGGTRFAYSNSIAHDNMLPNSPGLVLIKDIIDQACSDPDLDTIDLGLGEERYKTGWADPVPLCDSLKAVTWKGSVKLAVEKARLRAKATVRNSPVLWPLVRRLRKWKAGLSKAPDQKT
ncbi:GNAT family N-acetyltransferase [Roseibium sediminicola]|uniref:GNAT family N-acetyltransferase n=1 Tax=Roseibium sediminicola TaxID=2933272 RepID=A0ABT0H2P6_9HYPH|nr:GNAT family N-acetyltransferase [Roseibium sp. CAU 1639]MCK7615896.1 GNAT family N-acetyltransferase [Roseibium sp. CAU 1639]